MIPSDVDIKHWGIPGYDPKGYPGLPDVKKMFASIEHGVRDLSSINIFVGSNNSGKSLLLRTLFRDGLTPTKERLIQTESVSKVITQILHEAEYDEVGCNTYHRQLFQQENSLKEKFPPNIADTMQKFQRLTGKISIQFPYYSPSDKKEVTTDYFCVYVPVIRSLRDVAGTLRNLDILDQISIGINREIITATEDLFLKCLTEEYWKSGRHLLINSPTKNTVRTHYVETGQNLFKTIKSYLLGNRYQREIINEYEEFLSRTFFSYKSVSIIPKENSSNTQHEILNIRIGEEERQIHELGDGIQQIIIQTLPMYLFKDKHLLLFIEEPEQNLHPAYQRILLDAFYTTSPDPDKSRQIFLTTHSNHFLDLTLDQENISYYRVSKNEVEKEGDDPTFEVENTSPSAEILQDLGVNSSSVLLSNCSIWVEGISERIYFRKYLELHHQNLVEKAIKENKEPPRELKEDIHYSFVEYAGSNISHWSFLEYAQEDEEDEKRPIKAKAICKDLFLIVDNDKAVEENKVAKIKLHEKLLEYLTDQNFYELKAVEIENLVTPKIVAGYVSSNTFKYGEDVRINGEYTAENYATTRVGQFIYDELMLDETKVDKKRKKSWSKRMKTSGTLTDDHKKGLREFAIEKLSSFENMSEEAKKLTIKLYEFIKSKNSIT